MINTTKQQTPFIVQSDLELQLTFELLKSISHGSFGWVYKALNKKTKQVIALKIDVKGIEQSSLYHEYYIMKKLQNIEGIPKVYSMGNTKLLIYIQMQYIEHDLAMLMEKSNIDESFICRIAAKVIKILKEIHARQIIHRDIKPQNIMIDSQQTIYLIDFGVSQIYTKSNIHKSFPFVGTTRYASIAAHEQRSQIPRDDIQSLLYTLIFLFSKSLPWICNKSAVNQRKIKKIKKEIQKEILCQKAPKQLLVAFKYIEGVESNTPINYKELISLFKNRTKVKMQIHRTEPTQKQNDLQIEQNSKNNIKRLNEEEWNPNHECDVDFGQSIESKMVQLNSWIRPKHLLPIR